VKKCRDKISAEVLFGGEECAREGVIELMTIVALYDFDGVAKLCGDISEKMDKVEKVSDLTHKGKVHTKWDLLSRITR
jgi:hypothetical protein